MPRVFPLPRPYLEGVTEPAPPAVPRRTSSAPTRTSPRLQRRRTEPISSMISRAAGSQAASRRNLSNAVASPSPTTTPRPDSAGRPLKKARLCDDIDEVDISPKKSKFFSAVKTGASPRKTKSEAYLLSDDSIDEALRNLPDIDGWQPAKRSKKSISIFEESQETTQATSQETSQGTSQGTEDLPVHEDKLGDFTDDALVSLSKAFMAPPKSTKPLYQSQSPRQSLSRFSYSSRSSTTPMSSMSTRSSVFSSASTPSTAPSTAQSRQTPLQRLGAKAFNSPMSPKLPKPRQNVSKHSFLASLPANPSFVPLPKVDLDEVEALNRPCGSEDQIFPDSDGEEAVEPARKLDLSRFAFS